ncbi:MAG TPA: glycosyltransferase family 2 protein [Blastocatellia bacterium]|nr:glycosyltransferase family 2 protein [Blastocatellia bacterium]
MRISATVITLNEEHNIADALKSLRWADEIIVVDSESTDRTTEIARQFTDRVFVRPWPGYSAQKNFAAEQARNEWVFNLDADERVSEDLASEIETIINGPEPVASGYEMPRLTCYLGRWIKHSGWYPDYKLRLYRRDAGSFRGDYVHESVQVSGKVGRLKGEILHFTIRNSSEHHLRLDRYTTLAAEEQIRSGKRESLVSLLFSPVTAFMRSYFFRLGFLDGIPGLAIAYFAAHYVFLKKLKVWEAGRSKRDQAR